MTDTGNDTPTNDALLEQLRQTTAEREAVLQQEIEELRASLDRLMPVPAESQPTELLTTTEQPDTGLSRRRLIRMAGAGAAVGIAAVGATVAAATPAAADPNNPLVIGVTNSGASTITTLTAGPGPNSSTLAAINTNTDQPIGLYGIAGSTSGLQVAGGGVVGNSHDLDGVVGFSYGGDGVAGFGHDGDGVYGFSQNGNGVLAETAGGAQDGRAALRAFGNSNPGVLSVSDTTHGVIGLAQGSGVTVVPVSGVLGAATSSRGVTGVATTGIGTAGQTGAGIGVQGTAAGTGVAAQFGGGRAQLYLVPSTTVTGHPTTGTHKAGELFMDKTSALYVCKTAGTPGTWKLLG